jgi:acetate---CoA ligase (ADP-forming)
LKAHGLPPADVGALAQALSRLSLIAVAWQGRFASIEINPLLVRSRGAGIAALEALILMPSAELGSAA